MDFILGLIAGILLSAFVVMLNGVPTSLGLEYAQSNYLRCLTDGAPKERCIEIYLLPKDKP